MADLIRPSLGGGNSSTISMSFWFNTPTGGANILDCTGFYDVAYPSVQVGVGGVRQVFVDCANPAGMNGFTIDFEGTDRGYQGEEGEVAAVGTPFPGGAYWLSVNSTGPTDIECKDAETGLGVEPNPMAAQLPYDGSTYFTGWGIWNDTTKGGFSTQSLQLQGLGDISTSAVKGMFYAAAAQAQAISDSLPTYVGPPPPPHYKVGYATVSDTHHAVDPPPYIPEPKCGWLSKTNACSTAGNWTHVALSIDTGHGGPYPNSLTWSGDYGVPTPDVWVVGAAGSDLKRAIMRINGVYANLGDSPNPVYDGPTLPYSTSFNMDFSGSPAGIPYLNNARASHSLPTNPYVVRLANLQIWCGHYIDWMNAGNFSEVVILRDGKGYPAPLSMAGAAFGTPTVRMSGNNLQFPINTGTGGAFTKEGTITDFTPTPSY